MTTMKITANTLMTRNSLELKQDGIAWTESSAFGGVKFFRFEQIDAVLRGPQTLSFQAGTETHQIAFDPNNADHRALAARLASEAKRTVRKN